jgi:DNA-binding MarR family transcriptional regulator
VARVEPLSPIEGECWRALMGIMLSLPRRVDKELRRAVGINTHEYLTLMSLSEAQSCELRMTDLPRTTALSASRVTRVVDELESRGLATKRGSSVDGRSRLASVTSAGLTTLESARAAHVSSVRTLVFDHVDGPTANYGARALARVAARLEGKE